METKVDPDKVEELASEFKRLSRILEDGESGLNREMLDLIRETNAEYDEGYVRNTTAEMEILLREIRRLTQSITDRLNEKSKVLENAASNIEVTKRLPENCWRGQSDFLLTSY